MLTALFFVACLADQPGVCKPETFGPFYDPADCAAMIPIIRERAPADGVTILMATCAPFYQQKEARR